MVASTWAAAAAAAALSLGLASSRKEHIRSLLVPEVLEMVPALRVTQVLTCTPIQAPTAAIPRLLALGAPLLGSLRVVVRVVHRHLSTRLLVMEALEGQVVAPLVTQMAQLGRAVLQLS